MSARVRFRGTREVATACTSREMHNAHNGTLKGVVIAARQRMCVRPSQHPESHVCVLVRSCAGGMILSNTSVEASTDKRGREGGGGEDGGSDTEAKVAGSIRFTGL